MPALVAAPPRYLQLHSEYDVIAMRQEVRQLARDLGLELSRQAKITTAISTIARAIIAANGSTTLRMRVDERAPRTTLEIACSLAVKQTPEDLAHLEQVLQFGAARALVDEASLALDGQGALLCLRMGLNP